MLTVNFRMRYGLEKRSDRRKKKTKYWRKRKNTSIVAILPRQLFANRIAFIRAHIAELVSSLWKPSSVPTTSFFFLLFFYLVHSSVHFLCYLTHNELYFSSRAQTAILARLYTDLNDYIFQPERFYFRKAYLVGWLYTDIQNGDWSTARFIGRCAEYKELVPFLQDVAFVKWTVVVLDNDFKSCWSIPPRILLQVSFVIVYSIVIKLVVDLRSDLFHRECNEDTSKEMKKVRCRWMCITRGRGVSFIFPHLKSKFIVAEKYRFEMSEKIEKLTF